MTKILAADGVDDMEVLIRQKFRQEIRNHELGFNFAQNGREPLEIIKTESSMDILRSDIKKPDMHGLSLLLALSESYPLIKTVIVSAYGDMENIRTAMNRGAFVFIAEPINFEDPELTFRKTAQHVIQLREGIKAIRENHNLKMYVDEHVLQFISSAEFERDVIASEYINASVAFIDICSFTSFSEIAKPDYVVKLRNSYFDVMVKEIIAQEGRVDRCLGDCIMAVFDGDYHLDRAVDAYLAIGKRIKELEPEEKFISNVSFGINSGEMISGNIGSAALRGLDCKVIGDVVNAAQRLKSIAASGHILIEEICYKKIKDSFHCERIGSIQLKNKAVEQLLFEIIQ